MKIIKFQCKTIEPIIVSDRVIKNIIESSETIPATTIRGALIKKIALDAVGYINDVTKLSDTNENEKLIKNLILNPDFRISPLTFIMNGKECKIAHIFFFKRKILRNNKSKIFSSLITREDFQNFMTHDHIEEFYRYLPDIKEGYPKTICGSLLVWSENKFKIVKLRTWFYENVAINRIHGVSESKKLKALEVGKEITEAGGLLYSYEAFQPGIKFRFHIVDTNNQLVPLLNQYNGEIDIYIGRGTSRGFGLTKCKFTINDIEEEFESSNNYIIHNNYVTAIAISPIFSMDEPGKSKPYISKVELKNQYTEGKAVIKEIINEEGDQIPAVFMRSTVVKSWAYRYGPRPTIIAAAPGSLYIYRISSNAPEKFLRYLELTGMDNLSRMGYNYVRFVKDGEYK